MFRGLYTSVARTLTSGQAKLPSLDVNGNLIVNTNTTGAAGAAASDAKANPTLGNVLSFLMGFNGTTWDRLRTAVVTPSATLTGILNTLNFAVYNASPTVRTEGQGGPLQADTNGNLKSVIQNPAVAVDDVNGKLVVEHRYSFTNITTQTTTTVKSGAGLLHCITINTIGATGTITIYDNTTNSGTKIGTITLPAAGAGDMPTSILFDVSFGTGLTIVTATASNDITVSYR